MLVAEALNGDVRAAREIADRIEGRPALIVQEQTHANRPIVIQMMELDLKTM